MFADVRCSQEKSSILAQRSSGRKTLMKAPSRSGGPGCKTWGVSLEDLEDLVGKLVDFVSIELL